MLVAIATRADQAWLVVADQRVTPGLVVRLTLARSRQTIIVAATRLGGARSPASSRAAADASSAPHPATWRLRPPAPGGDARVPSTHGDRSPARTGFSEMSEAPARPARFR